MSEKEERQHPDGYVRKDVYFEYKKGQEAICNARHGQLNQDVKDLQDAQKAINRKISATLVFTILTLVSIVVAIGTRALT